MKQKSGLDKAPAERVLKDIRRQNRRHYSAEEKIRIVLEGLRGEENISELCRREGIAASMYYGWSKEFLEAGKRRLAGGRSKIRVKATRRRQSALTKTNRRSSAPGRLTTRRETRGNPLMGPSARSWRKPKPGGKRPARGL